METSGPDTYVRTYHGLPVIHDLRVPHRTHTWYVRYRTHSYRTVPYLQRQDLTQVLKSRKSGEGNYEILTNEIMISRLVQRPYPYGIAAEEVMIVNLHMHLIAHLSI